MSRFFSVFSENVILINFMMVIGLACSPTARKVECGRRVVQWAVKAPGLCNSFVFKDSLSSFPPIYSNRWDRSKLLPGFWTHISGTWWSLFEMVLIHMHSSSKITAGTLWNRTSHLLRWHLSLPLVAEIEMENCTPAGEIVLWGFKKYPDSTSSWCDPWLLTGPVSESELQTGMLQPRQ